MKERRCLNCLTDREIEKVNRDLKKVVIVVKDVVISVVFHICYNYGGDKARVAKDVDEALMLMNMDFSKKGSNYNLGEQIYDSKKIPKPTLLKLEPILPVKGTAAQQKRIKRANRVNANINKERQKVNGSLRLTYAATVTAYDQNLKNVFLSKEIVAYQPSLNNFSCKAIS